MVRPNGEQLATIGRLIDEGVVQIPHIEERSIDEVADALSKNKAGHTQGKVVLRLN